MGYYTRFNLTWTVSSEVPKIPNCDHNFDAKYKFCPECGAPAGLKDYNCLIEGYILADKERFYAIDSDGSSRDTCKWYEHEEDMKIMSKQFKNVIFKLHGEGEESGDIWDKYFLNGKMQVCRARIVCDGFDAKQLK